MTARLTFEQLQARCITLDNGCIEYQAKDSNDHRPARQRPSCTGRRTAIAVPARTGP